MEILLGTVFELVFESQVRVLILIHLNSNGSKFYIKWPCLFHKLDQKVTRNVRGIGEAYHNVSRSATKDVIGGHTLCSLWQAQGRTRYVHSTFSRYVFGSTVRFR